MSLFSHEEICAGCGYSEWIEGQKFWHGQPVFAFCGLGCENRVDHTKGTCLFKEDPNEVPNLPKGDPE